jgi:glycosyltransferase involved in cell wall biosynthesis
MKHKVLIVNKFYYPRGGDCVVSMSTEELLSGNGCETAVFAMQFPENNPSPWQRYFAPQVEFSGSVGAKLRAARRVFGRGDVVKCFNRLLDDFRPDLVLLNNIHSYLSPVLAELAHRRGIRVLWVLHDYKLFCPSYRCLRDGQPCSECIDNPKAVWQHRCMKGSAAASMLALLEARKWNRRRLVRSTDMFICPSRFMRSMMVKAGFPEEKLAVVCNMVEPRKFEIFRSASLQQREDYYCYSGRLSAEKGVESLLEAASRLPYHLKIAGDGPLLEELRSKYARFPQIEFLGRLDAQGVSSLLSEARAMVVPSVWYENNPLSVIESLCAGTPVLGAEIGGIPELIETGRNGLIFNPGDTDAIAGAVERAFARQWDNAAIRHRALAAFSPQRYLDELRKLF